MKKILVLSLLMFSQNLFAGGGSSIGVGNPAILNCLKLTGHLMFAQQPSGQSTYCAIEQWQLFQQMSSRHLVKEHPYNNGGANPAAVNCLDIGGTLRAVQTASGQNAFCVVEAWTLFKIINVLND